MIPARGPQTKFIQFKMSILVTDSILESRLLAAACEPMLVKSLLVNPADELLVVFLFVYSLLVNSLLANQCP